MIKRAAILATWAVGASSVFAGLAAYDAKIASDHAGSLRYEQWNDTVLITDPALWLVDDGNEKIGATPDENTLVVPLPAGESERFFALVERNAPPIDLTDPAITSATLKCDPWLDIDDADLGDLGKIRIPDANDLAVAGWYIDDIAVSVN